MYNKYRKWRFGKLVKTDGDASSYQYFGPVILGSESNDLQKFVQYPTAVYYVGQPNAKKCAKAAHNSNP